MVGIDRGTILTWRGRGQEKHHPAYVAFEKAITEALLRAKQALVHGLAVHPDWKAKSFILKNRYPKEYRDHIVQELTGAEGGPLLPGGNDFVVKIELKPQAGPVERKAFTIVEPDGRRHLWNQGEELPPHKESEPLPPPGQAAQSP